MFQVLSYNSCKPFIVTCIIFVRELYIYADLQVLNLCKTA